MGMSDNREPLYLERIRDYTPISDRARLEKASLLLERTDSTVCFDSTAHWVPRSPCGAKISEETDRILRHWILSNHENFHWPHSLATINPMPTTVLAFQYQVSQRWKRPKLQAPALSTIALCPTAHHTNFVSGKAVV